MSAVNYRTVPVDAYDPDSSVNFDLATLRPDLPAVSANEVQSLAGQLRQLLRGGDAEGALRGALENAPYGGDARAKVGQLSRLPGPGATHTHRDRFSPFFRGGPFDGGGEEKGAAGGSGRDGNSAPTRRRT